MLEDRGDEIRLLAWKPRVADISFWNLELEQYLHWQGAALCSYNHLAWGRNSGIERNLYSLLELSGPTFSVLQLRRNAGKRRTRTHQTNTHRGESSIQELLYGGRRIHIPWEASPQCILLYGKLEKCLR